MVSWNGSICGVTVIVGQRVAFLRWPSVSEIVVVGHPQVLGLELFGVLDVYEWVNRWLSEQGREPNIRVEVLTLAGGPVQVSRAVELCSSGSLIDYDGPIDTLIVPGGHNAVSASEDSDLVRAVKDAALRSRRVVSLCTGAFILAATGILDDKRATTHWDHGALLAERYPMVCVDTKPIFTRDGRVWTSAGVTASFDLLLALIEEDLGTEAARFVARSLVLFLRRTGNQAQFSVQLSAQLADRFPIRELQQLIADRPDGDLSIAGLARRVHMSPRHFTRVFRSEVGISPGRYVERLRLETARRRLEESNMALDAVATTCGLGSAETLRRLFVQRLGVSPGEYRRRFGVDHRADEAIVG